MRRAETRRIVLCALVVLLLGIPQAQAALQELPMRQGIMDNVAVLRHLYKFQLDYETRMRLVSHNIRLTTTQIETIDKLILSETREPGGEIARFVGYARTYQELLEQLRQFGPNEYIGSLEKAKTTLNAAVTYAQAQRDGVEKRGDKAALEDFDRMLTNLQEEVTAIQSRIDRYAANPGAVDYIKTYTKRREELLKEIRQFEGSLGAKMAEYKALFGHDAPVSTDYKSDIDRLYPADAEPGLLVTD